MLGSRHRGLLWRGATALGEATLASYSQVLFSRYWLTGALLLAATATDPRLLAAGVVGVVAVNGLAWAVGMGGAAVRSGLFGLNGLLVALAAATWLRASSSLAVVLALALVAVVFVTAGLRTLLGQVLGLPVLSLPFVLVTFLLLAAVPSLSVLEWRSAGVLPLPEGERSALWLVETYLRVMGSLVFRPEPLAGGLVLGALVAASRISAVLSLVGFAVAVVAQALLAGGTEGGLVGSGMALNVVLISVALGGFFFVASPWSLVLAAAGCLMGVLVTAAANGLVQSWGLPVLILPFNLTVLAGLYGMRQRLTNRWPVQYDLVGESPEASLYRHQARVARFGWTLPLRLSLPFRGTWIVTQGWDGSETHRDAWRHGWDFEVADQEGRRWRGEGTELTDYLCYRLPVLAPADGVVVAVIDGHKDNPRGAPDLLHNWGNVVILRHAAGLYSTLAHLSPGSIKVTEGGFVRGGEQVALCGNSGRSAVPHLHLQFQATAVLGAPTIPGEFHDLVLVEAEHQHTRGTLVPQEGQRLRNLSADHRLHHALRFPAGSSWTFMVTDPSGQEKQETIISEVKLLGDRVLRSREKSAMLTFANDGPLFHCLEYQGTRESVLAALHLALSRVPLEPQDGVQWHDLVAWGPHRPRLVRWLCDAAALFGYTGWRPVRFQMHQSGGRITVTGEAADLALRSTALLEPQQGLVEVAVTAPSWQLNARRADARN